MNIQDYLKEMKKNTYLYYKCSTCAKIQKDKINISNYFNYCLKCEKIYCDKCFELHLNNNNMDKKMHKAYKALTQRMEHLQKNINKKTTTEIYIPPKKKKEKKPAPKNEMEKELVEKDEEIKKKQKLIVILSKENQDFKNKIDRFYEFDINKNTSNELKEKIYFTGVHRGFKAERVYLLNMKREEAISSLELRDRETLDDRITKYKLKYA